MLEINVREGPAANFGSTLVLRGVCFLFQIGINLNLNLNLNKD